MKKTLFIVICLTIGIVAALYLWQTYQPRQPAPTPAAEKQFIPIPEQGEESGILHPISGTGPTTEEAKPEIDREEPLPALEKSDERIRALLSRLFAGEPVEKFFIPDNFIQRFVVMVDNLPRRDLPVSHLPTRPVAGRFLVTGGEDNLTIDPANYRRYTPFIRLVDAVDPKRAVASYVRFYPLFQQAYEDLGYQHGYFNDRLIEVIDHLLATPEVSGPIALVRPKVYYHYADPELQSLSAGRKILIRTGPENAARIKRLLRQYRQELAAESRRN